MECICLIVMLLDADELKPRDVRVAPSMSVFKHADPKSPPPVTYLHFYDSSEFSVI